MIYRFAKEDIVDALADLLKGKEEDVFTEAWIYFPKDGSERILYPRLPPKWIEAVEDHAPGIFENYLARLPGEIKDALARLLEEVERCYHERQAAALEERWPRPRRYVKKGRDEKAVALQKRAAELLELMGGPISASHEAAEVKKALRQIVHDPDRFVYGGRPVKLPTPCVALKTWLFGLPIEGKTSEISDFLSALKNL